MKTTGPNNERLQQAHELLLAIHEQLESPCRNTTMSSYRSDGSVIISSDIRRRVREWLYAMVSTETPDCAIEGCKSKAVCLLAVKGEWFPICKEHSTNKMFPRRNLFPPNEKLTA